MFFNRDANNSQFQKRSQQRDISERQSIQDIANQFPLSDEPRFHADEAWQALTRFRWHLIDNEHYEIGWVRKTITGLQEIGKKYRLTPSKEPFDSFIVVVSQFKARKPRKVEFPSPDQPCVVVMIEAGNFGETREVALHLDYLFYSDRRALIRWAEGWIRAREVQLHACKPLTTTATDTYQLAAWIDQATEGIYDENRLRKMRENGILLFKKQNGRYQYSVDSLIAADPSVGSRLTTCLNDPDFQLLKRRVRKPK